MPVSPPGRAATTGRSRPFTVTPLLARLVLLGVSGLGGGIGLPGGFIEPPQEWVEGSPFADYLLPGLAPFDFLGVFRS